MIISFSPLAQDPKNQSNSYSWNNWLIGHPNPPNQIYNVLKNTHKNTDTRTNTSTHTGAKMNKFRSNQYKEYLNLNYEMSYPILSFSNSHTMQL